MKNYRLTIFLILVICGILCVRYVGVQVLKPSLGLDSVYLSSVDVFNRIHEQPLYSPFNDSIDLNIDWYGNMLPLPGQRDFQGNHVNSGNAPRMFSLVKGDVSYGIQDFEVLPSSGSVQNYLSFSRIYHSRQANKKGLIGFGWRAFWEYELFKLEEKFYLKNPDGKITIFEFDAKLNAFIVQNEMKNTYSLHVQKEGVVIQDKSGKSIEFASLPGVGQFGIQKITYKNGHNYIINRNAFGLPGEIIEEASGRKTEYMYFDDLHLIKTVRFPSGYELNLKYDAYQNLSEISSSANKTSVYKYESTQNVHLLTDVKDLNFSANLNYADMRIEEIKYANGDYVKIERDFIQGLCKVRSIHGGNFTYWNKSRFVWDIKGPLDFYEIYRFNHAAKLVGYVDSQGKESQYSWDESGHMIQRETVQGIELFDYEQGNLSAYTDFNGSRYFYRYENGLLRKMIYPDGTAVSYNYDGNVPSSRTYDAINETINYVYNVSRLLTQEIISGGEVLSYEYNEDGYLTKKSSNTGWEDTFEWNGPFLLSMGSVDLDGVKQRELMFEYDLQNRTLTEKDNKNSKKEYHFNEDGNLIKMIGSDGRKSVYKKTADDLMLEYKVDGGNEKQWVYDGLGRLLKIQMGGKVLAQYEYDKSSSLPVSVMSNKFSRVRYFNGEVLEMQFAKNYQPSLIRFSNGREWHMEYGAGSRLLSFRDNWRGLFSFQYDQNGWLKYILDDQAETVSQFEHDILGNLLSAVKGQNGYFFEYHNGLPVMLFENFEPNGVQWKWDASSQLKEFINKDGTRFKYDYDLRGNVIGREYENIYHQYYFNSKMQLESKLDLMGRGYNLSYDDNGMVKEFLPINHDKTSWLYDLNGRTKRVTGDYPYELTWSNFDQLVKIAFDKKNLMLLAYNDMGQVVKKTYPGFIVLQNHFDQNGNLTAVSENGLDSVFYEYDTFGRLIQIKYPNGLMTTIGYNQSGYEDSRITVDSNGKELIKRVYEYDMGDRVVKVNTERGVQTRMFDSLGNITAESLDNKAKTSRQYRYDPQSLIRTYTESGEKETQFEIETGKGEVFRKFSLINKEKQQKDKNTVIKMSLHGTAAQDAGFLEVDKQVVQLKNNRYMLEQLQLSPGEKEIDVRYINALGKEYRHKFKLFYKPGTESVYLFDKSGKLFYKSIEGRILQYSYNDDLTLAQVQSAIGDQIIEYNYKYYGNGLLAEREIFNVSGKSSKRTQFIFDEKGNIVGELDKNEAGFDSLYMYNTHGQLVYRMDRANRKYYYHLDKDGSVIGISDPQGEIVASYSYDFFGGFSHRMEKVSNSFYFLGKYFETAIGFYFSKGQTYHEMGVFKNHKIQSSPSDFEVKTPDDYIRKAFPNYHAFKNAGDGFPFSDTFLMSPSNSNMKNVFAGSYSLAGSKRPLMAHLDEDELWFDFMYENPVAWNEVYFSVK